MEIQPFHDLCRDDLPMNWNLSPLLPEFAFGDYEPDFDLPPTPPLLPPRVSAFVSYVRPRWPGSIRASKSTAQRGKSVHMRMVEFLRTIPIVRAGAEAEAEAGAEAKTLPHEESGDAGSRCFRHMMRERQRRERLSQSYADLYTMVSPRSKADKNSIVQSSTMYLRELKAAEEELRRRNVELQGRAREEVEGARIRLRVGNPSSPVDSMIGALQCLKEMGVSARGFTWRSTDSELAATIAIETKMASWEVERAVQGVLVEVERSLRAPVRSDQGWSTVPSGLFRGS